MSRIIKETKSLGTLVISPIEYSIAKEIIINNHYSHKWNSGFGKYNYGIFKGDRLLGAAVYGNTMNNQHGVRKIIDDGVLVELNRLWVDDELGKNAESLFLGVTFKFLREEGIDVIQSFADGRLGCGTIYKATNFKYYGYHETIFLLNIETGEMFHTVPLENPTRPNGFIRKNKLLLDGKLKAYKVKTYRYIYKLNKRIKIKLKEKLYPNYEKGMVETKYRLSKNMLITLYHYYKIIGWNDYADKVRLYYEKEYNEKFTGEEITNKHIEELKKKPTKYLQKLASLK